MLSFGASGAYAQPPEPFGVTAWSGYHRSIRLTWFAPSGERPAEGTAGAHREDLARNRGAEPAAALPAIETALPARLDDDFHAAPSSRSARGSRAYRVRRSASAEGDYAIIAENLTSSWHRDDDVENGRDYFYTVSTVQDGLESPPSKVVSARARRDGNLIRSGFTQNAPAINGLIDADEWRNAAVVDITAPYTPGLAPVTAFVMNSATHLYIAVRDPNIPFPDEFNQIGIYFEQRRGGQWNDPPATPEGNIWVIYDSNFDETWNWFRGIRGDWPDVGFVQFGGVGTVQQDLGFLSGSHEFEVAINLAFVPLVSAPGRVISLGLFSDQTGDAPFSGDWPGGIFASPEYFKAPILYGDLVLATEDGSRVVLPAGNADGAALVAFPNPVRGQAKLRITAPRGGAALDARMNSASGTAPTIGVFDAAGRRVGSARGDAANREWSWDARDESGSSLPNGVYFFKLDGVDGASGRLLLLR